MEKAKILIVEDEAIIAMDKLAVYWITRQKHFGVYTYDK
jgi:hypothetical protein